MTTPSSSGPMTARDLVLAGLCPVCGAGPYRVPLQHVSRKHGLDHRRARDAFGLTRSEPACAPEHSAACRARWFRVHDGATPRRRGEPQRWSRRGRTTILAVLEAGRAR